MAVGGGGGGGGDLNECHQLREELSVPPFFHEMPQPAWLLGI